MNTKSKVRERRESLGYTQSELAEHANLSLRTIQRIESGKTVPKGHTLVVLAEALGVGKSELTNDTHDLSREDKIKIKLINLSALSFMAIPFGNIIFPLWLWSKSRGNVLIDEAGRKVINYQIIWSVATSILLICAPFVQKSFSLTSPLFLYVLLISMSLNLIIIAKTTRSIDKGDLDILRLPISIL
ncbi:MAG TPA: helix-turn-helix domain-containing protein [Fulvivirga sp.]|nr:helix-turn-helix domain-containing protein [Fulvivirga sp.]